MTSTSVSMNERLIPRKPIDFILLFGLAFLLGIAYFGITSATIPTKQFPLTPSSIFLSVCFGFIGIFHLLTGPINLHDDYVVITDRKGKRKRMITTEGDWVLPWERRGVRRYPSTYMGIIPLGIEENGGFQRISIEIAGKIDPSTRLLDFSDAAQLTAYINRRFAAILGSKRFKIVTSLKDEVLSGEKDKSDVEVFVLAHLGASAAIENIPVYDLSANIHAEIA